MRHAEQNPSSGEYISPIRQRRSVLGAALAPTPQHIAVLARRSSVLVATNCPALTGGGRCWPDPTGGYLRHGNLLELADARERSLGVGQKIFMARLNAAASDPLGSPKTDFENLLNLPRMPILHRPIPTLLVARKENAAVPASDRTAPILFNAIFRVFKPPDYRIKDSFRIAHGEYMQRIGEGVVDKLSHQQVAGRFI